MPVRFGVRGIVLGAVAFLLLASFLYSRSVRDAYLTPDLRYLPKENALAVVAGDPRSLWRAVDDHFGAVIRGTEEREPGLLAELVGQLRESLDEAGLRITAPGDLEAYGIDVDRSVLASLGRVAPDALPTVVLHVNDGSKLLEAFSRLTDLESSGEQAAGSTRLVTFGEDEARVALVEPGGTAVVAPGSDEITLHRMLDQGESNLRHALEDDAFYDGVRDLLRHPLGAGPALYLFWRPRELPGVNQVAAAFTLADEELLLRVDARVDRDLLAVADRLFEPHPERVDWSRRLGARTLGLLVIEDRAVSRYLRFLALSDALN